MPTRPDSALAWIEGKFSEGFLGKVSAFLREEPGKEFLKGPEDPSRDLSLKEGEGVATGIARLVKLYALDYPVGEAKFVSETIDKAKEGKFDEIEATAPTRMALWGFLGGGGEGVANLGLKAYEKEFTKVARKAIKAMQDEGFAASHINKIAERLIEAKNRIPGLAEDTFAAVDEVVLGGAGSPTQSMRSLPKMMPEKGVATTHVINPREGFRPKGITHEAGHALGSKLRYGEADIGLGSKEKAIFEKQQELRDSLLRRYHQDKAFKTEAEGKFPLHELSPAELHAEAIATKIEAAYPNKLSMADAFKQTLEPTYQQAKGRLLRKGEWPGGVRLLEGDADTALGATLMARIGEIKPEIKLRFDGVQEGFGEIPATLQMTPQAGPLRGRTFNVPKGSSPEDVFSHMEKMVPSEAKGAKGILGGNNLLREGGSKTPWVWSLLERTLDKPEFMAAKEMKGATLLNKLKKAGVSDAELEWTGLKKEIGIAGNRPVDMELVRNEVRRKGIKTEVATSGSFNSPQIFEPRHESMFINRPLPKGEGYRESLITLKHEGKAMQLPEHYDADNVVVGMLADIRKTSEGANALHLQEGQSDWARKGRELGYKPILDKRFKELDKKLLAGEKLSLEESAWYDANIAKTGVADMPFKGDEALKLGLKRMLWEASEEGADKLTWTRGKDIAERWSLRQAADEIHWSPPDARTGKGALTVVKDGAEVVTHYTTKEGLSRYVTQEQAATLLKDGILKGEGLELGKRWPYEIYDKKIPAMLKKLTREVGEEVVPRLEGAKYPKETFEALVKTRENYQEAISTARAGIETYTKIWKDPAYDAEARREALRLVNNTKARIESYEKALKELDAMAPAHPVHSLDLPESLRRKIQTKGFKISKKVAAAALEGIA